MLRNLWVYACAKGAIRNFLHLLMKYTVHLNVHMKNLENKILASKSNDSILISLNYFENYNESQLVNVN